MENNVLGVKKKIPPDATCFYCVFWSQLWGGLGEDFHYLDIGYCQIKRQDKEKQSRICKSFSQRPSVFTPQQRESFRTNK